MISDKQATQVCSFALAVISFFIAAWLVSRVQSAPDLTLPVEEIPQQYR
jgi:hypothetical protein